MQMLAACEQQSPEQPTQTIWGASQKVSSVSSKYAKGKAALSADVS